MRIGYVRRAYGVDGDDPGMYHLMLDSTALDLDLCVELIVTASKARIRSGVLAPRDTPTRERKPLDGLWRFQVDAEGAGRDGG